MENILSIRNLNLSFIAKKKKNKPFFLFKDLNIEIPREKVTALVGGNGVGKTTLFNVINGIIQVSSGEIQFNGKPIQNLSPHLIARKGIGRLFQGTKVFDELNVLDNMIIGETEIRFEKPFFNLLFAGKMHAHEEKLEQKAEKIFNELFGEKNIFWESRFEPAGNLSYGQQRLLAIARLLMGDFELYLLDEPTAGVNVHFIGQIEAAIQRMNSHSHKTVLFIEHNMQFVRKVADHCLFMANGSIIARGTPQEVLENNEVQMSYMGF